jgi:hypothetical protein
MDKMKRTVIAALWIAGLWGAMTGTAAQAHEIVLHFYPSPAGASWRTPRSLTQSVLLNSFLPQPFPVRHAIGHVAVGVRCGGEDKPFDELTGMTSADETEDHRLLLKEKVGLGILFHTFSGRLQDSTEVQRDIDSRLPTGGISWLRVEVSPQTCERALTYVRQFRDRGYSKFYGLPLRPRYGEGSGCSAFGASVLEVAGVLDPEFRREWWHGVDVPLTLMGNEGAPVSLLRLLFGAAARTWAAAPESGRAVEFWDPDAMNLWVSKRWQDPGEYVREQTQESRGLRLDRSSLPVPDGPIWLGR